jgi:hypothetical protein
MPQLTEERRDQLDNDQFAYLDSSGERKLPIHDEAHVRNAIARFSQTDFEDKSATKAAAHRIIRAAGRYGILLEDDDASSAPARPDASHGLRSPVIPGAPLSRYSEKD